jgi:hypothetical protein
VRVLHQSVFVLGLAALVTAPALAQPQPGEPVLPPDQAPIVIPLLYLDIAGLLMTRSVQEELKLTADQVKDISAAVRKVREKYQDDLAKLRTLGPKEQAELLAKVDNETRKAAVEVLKPDQAKRLKQIEWQMASIYAFLDEEVAKDLKLTDDQKGKIKGVLSEYQKDLTELSKELGTISVDSKVVHAHLKKVQKRTEAAMAEIEDVLTGDQRKAWKELIGEPFELTG